MSNFRQCDRETPYLLPPSVLLALLIYGYATGTFSSRRIEQASYASLAFRYIAANTHPDHDTLCTFRKRFLPEIEALFVQVLSIARQMKWLKLGTVALDGTKLHANASRHSAWSYGHAQKIEAQLEAEVGMRSIKHMLAEHRWTDDGLHEHARRGTSFSRSSTRPRAVRLRCRQRLSPLATR